LSEKTEGFRISGLSQQHADFKRFPIELNQCRKSDDEQLRYAAEQEGCLVSFNVRDFVMLHCDYVRREEEHFGIVVSKQLPVVLILLEAIILVPII